MERSQIIRNGLVALLIPATIMSVLAVSQWQPPATQAQQAGSAEVSLNVLPGSNVNCLPAQKPDKCLIDTGTRFTLSVNVNVIPLTGYAGYQVDARHPGLTSKDVRHVASDQFPLTTPVEGIGGESFFAAALTAVPPLLVDHLGPIMEADLNCPTQPGTFKISLPLPGTRLKDANGDDIPLTTVLQDSTKVADTLLINCRDPLAADGDQDGCTGLQETGPNPQLGGGRDPRNFWDFFDTPNPNATPQRDRVIDIGDIVRVVDRFGTSGDPTIDPLSTPAKAGYHTAYDRTLKGPNAWNTGPPNGVIDVQDIVLVVAQFGHTCAAPP